MHVTKITLDEFRRYQHLKLTVPRAGLRIVGRNASGKSSILEALLLLATTRSPRAGVERELIRWESGEQYGVDPYARISTHVVTAGDEHDLELRLEASASGSGTRKSCLVDDRSVRATTMVGILKVVEFSPEDVQLVSDPPGARRRQIDILISQIDRHYMQASSRYQKVLSQRNGLLRSFARDGVAANSPQVAAQLGFWDDELIQHGSVLIAHRLKVTAALAERMREWSIELLGDLEVDVEYTPGVRRTEAVSIADDDIESILPLIRDRFSRELDASQTEDVRRGTTSIGPQRDDFVFKINGRSLAAFGSRGQQRLGVIAFKLSEADIIERLTGEKPVLLLDDALSELDASHASWLLNALVDPDRQLLLTSAVEGVLDRPELDNLEKILLDEI